MKSFHIPNPIVLMTMILVSLPSFTWEFDEQLHSMRSAFAPDERSFDKFFMNIKSSAQTGAVAALLNDLQKKEALEKIFELFETTRPIREFVRTVEGEIIVSYLKGYIRDNETRRFFNKVIQFTQYRGIYSRFFPHLCLSESLTPFQLRKEFCTAAMSWYGFDSLRSRELLEHATTLNSHGLIDLMMNLSIRIQALGGEFENEIHRAYTLFVLWFLSTDEESRSFAESLLRRELPQHSKERLFQFIFESNGLESLFETIRKNYETGFKAPEETQVQQHRESLSGNEGAAP